MVRRIDSTVNHIGNSTRIHQVVANFWDWYSEVSTGPWDYMYLIYVPDETPDPRDLGSLYREFANLFAHFPTLEISPFYWPFSLGCASLFAYDVDF